MLPLRRFFLLGTLVFVLVLARESRADVNGLLREVYSGLGGSLLANLTNAAIFPNGPTSSNLVTDFFETPSNLGDNYGQRLRALIVAPETGNYVFWIASDDQGALYLSTNDLAVNKRLICAEPQWNASRDWDNIARRTGATNFFPSMNPNLPANRSDYAYGTITLQAGARYYIEALHKEGGGSDNLAVQWQLPSGGKEGPIPASRLIVTGVTPPVPPVITLQPTNVTIIERGNATFSIQVNSFAPPTFQWQKNGTNISGATSTNLFLIAVPISDNSAHYHCVITSALGTNVTADAILTVNPDITPPTIIGAANEGLTNVVINFSEPLEAASATNLASYQLSGGATIFSASLFGSSGVRLITSTLINGAAYTLTVNNVRDQSSTPNSIAPNSQKIFTVLAYTPWDIGPTSSNSSIIARTNGFDVTQTGGDIARAADQFLLSYQRRTGDFDVRVRVQSMDLTDPWAKAGLMARETLETNSVFAASLATPTISGSTFVYRPTTGAATISAGYFPINYPNTWLRLQRTGNLFTGYAGFDGQSWSLLGSVTLTISNTVYLGMAVSSKNAAQPTTARFRDLAENTGGVVTNLSINLEPPGPSSRRTGLVFSEIMYHPADRLDGKNIEFIELMNTQSFPENIGGYRISGAIDFVFPTNTTIPAGGFFVVAKVPADVQSVYGLSNVVGPYTNSLHGSSTVRLRNRSDAVLLEVSYSGQVPWPAGADGAGHSLVLKRPSFGENDVRAWDISDQIGGSPGAFDGLQIDALRNVVINEFLAHTDDPLFDFIELYNHANQPIDISGCILSDDATTNKFTLPTPTIIPARGFVSFDQNQLGFALSAGGESIFFKNAAQTRIIDAVRFEGQANGVSMGRVPDGADQFYALASRTPGAANAPIFVADIVINEIMYAPLSGDSDDSFVELFNRGTNAANVGAWKFINGIDFTFPSNTVLAPQSYFVLAKNAAHLRTNYPGLNTANTFDFSGSLASGGERLALARPDQQITTNSSGVAVTNTAYIVVDEVTYGIGGRWGKWSDEGGSSLELIDPRSNHRLAANWADSDETAKAGWTNIEFTGVLDNGTTNVPLDSLHILLLGAGECLVDNVEVIGPGGTNLIANFGFETGTNGWFFQGNHDGSSLELAGGFGGGQCLHVRASGRGDTGANRIRGTLSSTLAPSNTVTLRAKVRWLKGNPEILLRLHGNWLEAAGRMALPTTLGTPGAANSRALTNNAPAIFSVTHNPILPAAAQATVVTARVHDPDGVDALTLNYRVDPSAAVSSIAMVDDGTGGDAVAGDGIFSATIPGQTNGALVAFYIQATDTRGAPATFPSDAPTRECLIRFGEIQPVGNFGTYRIWMTQATVNRWAGREHNSNEPLDITFVYGQSRVIYNAQSLYSGSPWHTPSYNSPVSNSCDYVFIAPDDDRFLGVNDFVFATVGNLGSDGSAQREQFAFGMMRELGAPSNYRRYFNLFVNGLKRGVIYEDSQQPNADLVKEWFPDDNDGQLHKVEDWFEFDNTGDVHPFNADANLSNFTTTGGAKKLARYRWNWRKRAVKDSASDYDDLFALVNAVNLAAPEPFTFQTTALVDIEEWMRVFAVEHFVGNWDSYGYTRGKNMYAYKPQNGKWTLLPWDIDFVLGSGGDGPTTTLFTTIEPLVSKMMNHPPFRRAYWRAFEDLLNGPLQDAVANPILDARFAAFDGNGISVTDPSSIKTYIASRKSYVASQLAAVASPFSITSNNGNDFSTNADLITLAGVGGIDVFTIRVNGTDFTPTWTSVSNWTLRLPLLSGTNALVLQGFDRAGNPIANASDTINITFSGTTALPQNSLAITEIMYRPAATNGAFVEIFNSSTNTAFDLSNYQLEGVDFTFPPGTVIGPRSFLLVVEDIAAFANTYGAGLPIAGQYDGKLSANGETLRLIKPGLTPDLDQVIDEVNYSSSLPWPVGANGAGASLQMIDPSKDHWRVANWSAVVTNGTNNGTSPQWQFVSATGTASTSRLYLYTDAPADFYIDELTLVAGANAAVGSNYIRNGDFETALSGPWTVSANLVGSSNSTAVSHSGTNSLRVVATAAGTTQTSAIWEDTATLVTNAQYTLGFWFLPSTNAANVIVRLSGSGITATSNIQTPAQTVTNSSMFTPGATNSPNASLPAFPLIWLNEIQTLNLSGITNRLGEHQPWIELYNSGTNSISLNGFYLSDNYTNLTRWPFPSNSTIGPGAFIVVWADGNSGNTISNEWHTNFRLSLTNGSLALSRSLSNQMQIVDYLDYGTITLNRSFGSIPDGQSKARQIFSQVTPGRTNNGAFAAVPVVINEFMASNTGTLADPADGHFDDWIELYNSGNGAVDLSGYTMTDTLSNPGQWAIPAGTIIPAHGYLLVWADGDTGQNGFNNDRHTSFQLSKGGEAIGLFSPDGSVVDSITFGQQISDVSMGRFPDGAAGFYFLTNATPRTANIYPAANNAPVFTSLPDRSINEGALLTFAVGATEVDAPPQTLTYSLDPGAPTGAAINATNGVFTWVPTEAQGPATYPITVRILDNGSPALSATQTFVVTVNEVNAVPLLSAIGNKIVPAGGALNFTATATDSDTPLQTLHFSLDPGAPIGATVDAVSGQFSWTPSAAQTPGSFWISLRVTDDGSPPLSDAQFFNVAVMGPARFAGLAFSGSNLSITVQTAPGKNYELQFTPALLSPSWTPVAGIVGDGTAITVTDDMSAHTAGFYRLIETN